MCDKVHSQEGNSPDYMLRSPNISKCKSGLWYRQLRSRLGSSHLWKKALQLVRRKMYHFCCENVRDLTNIPKQ